MLCLLLQFIGLKGRSELAAIGLGEGDGLDREVRELYTVILAASDNSVPALTSYASVSATPTLCCYQGSICSFAVFP